jgi:excinuclease ABC subunit A
VVIEHNTDVIRPADWVVDLGPGGGPDGGEIVYAGPVAGLAGSKKSLTGLALV